MRTRRGVISSGFRDSRDWVQLATEFGVYGIWLTNHSPAYDLVGSVDLGGVIGTPTGGRLSTVVGPRDRLGFHFSQDYYLQSSHFTLPSSTNQFASECWFKCAGSNPTSDGGIVLLDSSWASLWFTTSGDLYCQGPSSKDVTLSSLNDGQWHHYVRTSNGSKDELYIDGVLRQTWVFARSADSNVTLGIAGDLNYYKVAGDISSIAFYPNYLSSSQVKALYRASGPPYSDTWTYTSFDSTNFPTLIGIPPGASQIVSVDIATLMSGVSGFDEAVAVDSVSFSVECTDNGTATKRKISVYPSQSGYWSVTSSGSYSTWGSNGTYLYLGGDTSPGFDVSTGTMTVTYALFGQFDSLKLPGNALSFTANYLDGTYKSQITDLTVKWQ